MPNILAVTHTPPWPPTNGGQQRSNLLIRALQRCGSVDLMLIPRSPREDVSAALERMRTDFGMLDYVQPLPAARFFPWNIIRPARPKLVDAAASHLGDVRRVFAPDPRLSEWLANQLEKKKYDLIVSRYLKPTVLSGAVEYAPLIIDVDDLDTDRCRTQLEGGGHSFAIRAFLRRRLRLLEQLEPRLLDSAEHLWVCSEQDRERVGPERATILPNIPFHADDDSVPEPCPPRPDSKVILVVGSLQYLVNVRGIDRFLANAWPQIRQRCPEARFRIVGTGMSPRLESRLSQIPGVEPLGFVDDLREQYAECALTIAPIFEGGGTKIKVMESLLFGRTCVVTKHSYRGYEGTLPHRESLWVAGSDDELVEGCSELLQNPTLRETLASNGTTAVQEHFTFERFAAIVKSTVDQVIEAGSRVERRTPSNGSPLASAGRAADA